MIVALDAEDASGTNLLHSVAMCCVNLLNGMCSEIKIPLLLDESSKF